MDISFNHQPNTVLIEDKLQDIYSIDSTAIGIKCKEDLDKYISMLITIAEEAFKPVEK